MTHHYHPKHVAGRLGAFIAGAAAAGVAAMYYFYGPKGREHRKIVEEWTLRAKGDILDRLEDTKELTRDKYEEIVDGVLVQYEGLKKVGTQKANRLGHELKNRWEDIKKEVEEAADEAKTETEKERARRKIAREIKRES